MSRPFCRRSFPRLASASPRRTSRIAASITFKNANLTARLQRKELDFIQQLNHNLLKKGTLDHQVEGVIQSYELAFKMQGEVPEVTDISKESQATLDLYGVNKDETDDFARQCLLARRFAEAGVRFHRSLLRRLGSPRAALRRSKERAPARWISRFPRC
jgi:hypothetical protein